MNAWHIIQNRFSFGKSNMSTKRNERTMMMTKQIKCLHSADANLNMFDACKHGATRWDGGEWQKAGERENGNSIENPFYPCPFRSTCSCVPFAKMTNNNNNKLQHFFFHCRAHSRCCRVHFIKLYLVVCVSVYVYLCCNFSKWLLLRCRCHRRYCCMYVIHKVNIQTYTHTHSGHSWYFYINFIHIENKVPIQN